MFGGDDFFSEIEKMMRGGSRRLSSSSRAQTQSLLNTIETKKETILIFDLSNKKISSIQIKDETERDEYGETYATGQKVLSIKLETEETLNYGLPKLLAKRKLNHTFNNGILEVSLKK
jgi:HSP20 family molecular chaperone IbpA